MKTVTQTSITASLRELVDEHLQQLSFCGNKPYNLYQPMEYILSLKGKRVRPILTMLAYHAVTHQAPEKVVSLSLAVELFHNFTLMHDDIMDNAPLRRGNPTVHQTWNEKTAILSGDALLVYAVKMLIKDYPEKAGVLVATFTEIAMQVCEGQMSDMDFETIPRVGIDEYLEMIRKKTAILIGGAMKLGALAGDADTEIADKFLVFGENMGIAFQLQDDLLDAFPTSQFGKQRGGDIIANKKTFLLLKAYESADIAQRERLMLSMHRTQNPSQKVRDVIQLYQELCIPQQTQELISQYYHKALDIGRELSSITHFVPIQMFLQEITKRKI